jgi:hypothetical protein
MHPVELETHEEFAEKLGVSQNVLYVRGWVKLSSRAWYGDGWAKHISVTQKQLDYIYEWHVANDEYFDHTLFQVQ